MNPLISNRVEAAQDRQIVSHDKRVQSRTFALGDTIYVRNYGQGPKWVKGVVTEKEGPRNFIVEVMLSGQLTKWKRHTDQLRKYTGTSDSHDTFSDSTPVVSPQEEEEEEKEDNSDILVYGSFSSTPQQFNNSIVEPRRNPPRNRKPPDRLTY